MGRFKDYAQETTIHGLNEFFKHPSVGFRAAWAAVLLFMLGFFVYEATRAICTYNAVPTATSIEYTRYDDFPPVTVCTNDWLDPEKLEAAGFVTAEEQGYLLGPIGPSVTRPTNVVDPNLMDLPVVSPEVRAKMRKAEVDAGGYLNLISSFAHSFEQIGKVMCPPCLNESQAKSVIKEEGICWLIELGLVARPTTRMFRTPCIAINFQFPKFSSKNLQNPSYPGLNENSMFSVFFASAAKDVTSISQARALVGRNNFIDIHLVEKTRAAGCNNTANHTMAVCDMLCIEKMEANCHCNCSVFCGDTLGVLGRSKKACNWADNLDDEKCDFSCWKRAPESCNQCLPPCKTTVAEVTAFQESLQRLPEGTDMRITLRVENQFRLMRFNEYFSYTFETLLSTLGGISGLFLGASAISIVHTVYFCCCGPLFGERRRVGKTKDDEDGHKNDEVMETNE